MTNQEIVNKTLELTKLVMIAKQNGHSLGMDIGDKYISVYDKEKNYAVIGKIYLFDEYWDTEKMFNEVIGYVKVRYE